MKRLTLLSFVNFFAMPDTVNDDRPLFPNYLENNPVRPFTGFVQAGKFAFEGKRFDGLDIFRQPLDALGEAPGCNFIKPLKFF